MPLRRPRGGGQPFRCALSRFQYPARGRRPRSVRRRAGRPSRPPCRGPFLPPLPPLLLSRSSPPGFRGLIRPPRLGSARVRRPCSRCSPRVVGRPPPRGPPCRSHPRAALSRPPMVADRLPAALSRPLAPRRRPLPLRGLPSSPRRPPLARWPRPLARWGLRRPIRSRRLPLRPGAAVGGGVQNRTARSRAPTAGTRFRHRNRRFRLSLRVPLRHRSGRPRRSR